MRKKVSIVFMAFGVLLIAAAILLAVYNRRQEQRAADAVDSVMPLLHQAIEANSIADEPDSSANGPDPSAPETDTKPPAEETDSDRMPVAEIDGYGYIGYLSIPALGLELPVMSEWDYTRLKKSPCLYYGSVKTDNMVIAAHNYTQHFGRLSDLKTGDAVRFTDVDGTVYNYQVGDVETLPPTATEEMITSDWNLTLYTCTYGGKNRVTVRCERTIGK